MIPWLFQPTQLDMCETIAPIALPCSFFLISFLLLKGECSKLMIFPWPQGWFMVYSGKLWFLVSVNNLIICGWSDSLLLAADLDTYLIKHLDTGSFSSLRILLIVAMMYFTITFLVHIVEVLVPAGFKFFQFLYAKLWFIIKLVVFHSSDWEIDPETLVFFGAFFLLLWIELWVPLFLLHLPTGSNQLSPVQCSLPLLLFFFRRITFPGTLRSLPFKLTHRWLSVLRSFRCILC